MRRKYEVYIDGRPLWIVPAEDVGPIQDDYLSLEPRSAGEVMDAVRSWRSDLSAPRLVLRAQDPDETFEQFASGHHFVQAAGGCVTNEHKHLLAILRLGMWDLPKGKVDAGEAVDAGALRNGSNWSGASRRPGIPTSGMASRTSNARIGT
jgi:hypothetical protein